MKKYLLTLCMCALVLTSQARVELQPQVYNAQPQQVCSAVANDKVAFSYDFSNGLGEFTTYDEDGATPHEVAQSIGFKQGDSWLAMVFGQELIAGSNSLHAQVKRAKDWLISPAITVGEGHLLVFDVLTISYYGSVLEGQFSVMLSTTGNEIDDFTVELATEAKAPSKGWTSMSFDLSEYEGKTVYIAIVNTSMNKDLLAVDNFLVGIPEPAMMSISYSKLQGDVSVGQPISVSLKAGAGNTINKVEATLSCGEFTTTKTVTDMNLVTNVEYVLQFDETLPPPTPGVGQCFDVTLLIDDTHTLTSSGEIVTQSYQPFKRVVGEELTGTWCGYCIRGHAAMIIMEEDYSDTFIGVAVHIDDPMEHPDYASFLSSKVGGGAPAGCLSRLTGFIDPENFPVYHDEVREVIALADIAIEADWSENTEGNITLTASTTFALSAQNYNSKLEFVVVEDDVNFHDDLDYNQTNYYNDGTSEMQGFELLPNPIPGGLMYYDDVVRDVITSRIGYGINGSLPTTIEEGVTYTCSVEYEPSAEILNLANCEFIVLLIDDISGMVLNAAKCSIEMEDVKAEAVELYHKNRLIEEDEVLNLDIDKSLYVTACVLPYNATDKSVTWSSSNEAIATVNANGKVENKGAGGEVVITATTNDGGYTASYTINCVSSVDAIEADKPVVAVNDGVLVISNVAQPSSVRLYAADGRLISEQVVQGDVRIENLERGIYIVRVGDTAAKVSI